jgi:hypothetical protein
MLRQLTLVMFRRAKSKRRKAAGTPNTGEYSGDRRAQLPPETEFRWLPIQVEGVLASREAQPFRRLNRGKRCLTGH